MKNAKPAFVLAAALSIILCTGTGLAQSVDPGDKAEKTLSPYFLVTSEDAEVDQFALESTSADVDIASVIADVTVTQVYKNDGKKPIEAVYVFPASTRAAVYGMKMTIGERTIEARIKEREKARQEYEKAKKEGKSASLLEQERPNVFRMSVANILPGDVIKVELKYTELLEPVDSIYEFIYPTVVGPRYSNLSKDEAPASEHWVENPYLHEGEKAPYDFDINVSISAGMPIQKLSCPTHKTNAEYEGKSLADIKLDPAEKAGGNRDFILKYRLAGGEIQSGLLLYEGEEENFFLLTVQPPERVEPEHVPPREYVFIVDVSGSMRGFPLDTSKKLMKDLIGNLRPIDSFNVLLFAGGSKIMSDESVPASKENIEKATQFIDRQHGGGGTELLPALERALALPGVEGVSRTVVIVTDGYVSVGKKTFDLIRNNLGKSNMFTFGIGSGVNRHLIEGMARVGAGEPFVITGPGEAPAKAARFRKIIRSPVLTNIEVDFGRFDVYEVEPPSVPDVLAERPVTVFGKWRGRPVGKITVKGMSGKGDYRQRFDVSDFRPRKSNSALRYLWARKRIQILDDYNNLDRHDVRVKEVTRLGLKYNLLTAYTSFVAIDSKVRLKDGKAVTVKQPLPLPQGVGDSAVGRGGNVSHYYRAPSLMPSPAMEKEVKPRVTAPQIKLEDIKTSGGIERRELVRLFEKERSDIDKCRINAGKAGFAPSGRIKIKIEIGPDGKVKKVTVVSSGLADKGLEKCIREAIKKWRFSKTGDAKSATAAFTVVLQ